jgi:plasmid maintenance system antidote protein VapI
LRYAFSVFYIKCREFTKSLVAERTGLDPKTITKIFNGDPSVAIGAYLKVMAVFGMESNFADIAAHDELGIKRQNMKLLEKKR